MLVMISRRHFVAAVTAAPLALEARTLKNVGVQLYTVRNLFPKQSAETLKALESIGFKEVEVVYSSMNQIWTDLKATSMKPVSLHLETAMFTRNQDKLPAALDDAKARGFRYVVCPYVAKEDRGGAEVMRKLGDTLNKVGELARKNGLQLCYHNHAFEFAPAGNDGNLLDVLLKTADPKLVGLELDIMWAQVAGVKPETLIQKYGNRVILMHLKDVAKAEAQRFDESVPPASFKEAGTGAIDFAAVLKAAGQAGVKHYFVEQDQTSGDPIGSLRQSYQYLSKLNY